MENNLIITMERKQSRTFLNRGLYINFFATIVWAIIEITPYLSRNTGGYLRLIVFAFWFLSLVFVINPKLFFKSKLFLIPLAMIVYEFFMMAIGFSNVSLFTLIDRWRLYFIPLCLFVIIRGYSQSQSKSLFSILLIIFVFNLISNIYLFGAGIVRNDISIGDATLGESARKTNAGDTSFCFLAGFISLLSLFLLFNNKKKIVLSIFLAFLSIWYLFFLNSRAIIIVLLLICGYIVICYFFIKRNRSISLTLKVSLIFVFSLLLFFNAPSIFRLLGNIKGNEWMNEKMNDLAVFLSGGGISHYGSLYSRFSFYGNSLKTYFNSPLSFVLGIGEQKYESASAYFLNAIGISGHSDIFDQAAQYGTIGLFLMLSLYFCAFKEIWNMSKNKQSRFFTIVIGVFFFAYGFLNHFTFGSILFSTFILFPLFLRTTS